MKSRNDIPVGKVFAALILAVVAVPALLLWLALTALALPFVILLEEA